jgi:hypothetical protein
VNPPGTLRSCSGQPHLPARFHPRDEPGAHSQAFFMSECRQEFYRLTVSCDAVALLGMARSIHAKIPWA